LFESVTGDARTIYNSNSNIRTLIALKLNKSAVLEDVDNNHGRRNQWLNDTNNDISS